jgi:hypothetical protein
MRSSLVNKNNLNYVGPTPNVEYYNNNIDIVSYTASLSVIAGDNDTGSTKWSLREETLSYLAKDLISLLEILVKFQQYL